MRTVSDCAQLHRVSSRESGQWIASSSAGGRRQTGEGLVRTRIEVRMSRTSGDRSRFNRLRKAKLHDRARIRALRNSLGLDEHPGQKGEAPAIEAKVRRVSESNTDL